MRTIQRAWVFDAGPGAAEAYAREMSAATGLPIVATVRAGEAVREADILCAATSTKAPAFADSDLKPGVHINGVGSHHPAMQEIPTETAPRAWLWTIANPHWPRRATCQFPAGKASIRRTASRRSWAEWSAAPTSNFFSAAAPRYSTRGG